MIIVFPELRHSNLKIIKNLKHEKKRDSKWFKTQNQPGQNSDFIEL